MKLLVMQLSPPSRHSIPLWELGTTLAINSSLILSTLMMEAIRYFLQEPLGVNNPEDGILRRHHRESLKSYKQLTGWTL
jgi:hypothetical protein